MAAAGMAGLEWVLTAARSHNSLHRSAKQHRKQRSRRVPVARLTDAARERMVVSALLSADKIISGEVIVLGCETPGESVASRQCTAAARARQHCMAGGKSPGSPRYTLFTVRPPRHLSTTTVQPSRAFRAGRSSTDRLDEVLQSVSQAELSGQQAKIDADINTTRAHGGITREDLDTLESRARSNPRSVRDQAVYYLAMVVNGLKISPRVESRQYPLNHVIVGLYREEKGWRKESAAVEPGALPGYGAGGVGKAIVRMIYHVCIVALLYQFLQMMSNNGEGGGNLSSILTEDGSYEVSRPDISFDDVAGNEHAKTELEALVGYLVHPEKYTDMGCTIPRGYLLSGPPGCGKTLLAKALAGEADVPFFHSSGSGFEEVFVGVGAGRIRKLFKDAIQSAPSIIFIDEIDSIGQQRKMGEVAYSNRTTLNQLLSCMDGFEDSSNVIVIAATNDPQSLDTALTREGRFDTKISITPPSLEGREDIMKVHCRGKPIAEDVDLRQIAIACPGMTGAQLAAIVNNAALRATLDKRDTITQEDLEEARQVVAIGDVNDDIVISAKEALNTAAHEAGHAIVTLLREEVTKRPVYISTIEPRGGSLGHVLPAPVEDQHTTAVGQMIAQIDICLGGRLGEELLANFKPNKVSTGCSSDMQAATRYAEVLIKRYGYNKEIGLVTVPDKDDDFTQFAVHEEIRKLFDERYEIVKADLLRNKQAWRRVTDHLVEYKTLTGGEVKILFEGGKLMRKPGELLPNK